MIAFVTSIGEKTTDLCVEQLKRYGFEVELLDKEETWLDKYKRFIVLATDDCLRIDADILVNKNVTLVGSDIEEDDYIQAHSYYDLYQNNLSLGGPIFYKKQALDIIRKNLHNLSNFRPETMACRLPELDCRRGRSDLVIGIHGIGQDDAALLRTIHNKTSRGQLENYDFELYKKINKL